MSIIAAIVRALYPAIIDPIVKGGGLPWTPNGGGSAVAPSNLVAPVISGTAYVGQTLTTTNGTWSGVPAPTFTYQWKRDGANISAATASTYEAVLADAGTDVTCTVTATNAVGSASADSNAIEPYHPANEAPVASYEWWPAYVTNGTGSEIASSLDASGNTNTLTAVGTDGARPTNATDAGFGGAYVATFAVCSGLRKTNWAQGSQSQPLTFITIMSTVGDQAIGTVYDDDAAAFAAIWRDHESVSGKHNISGGTTTIDCGGSALGKTAWLDEYQVDASGTDSCFKNDWTTATATGDSGGDASNGITIGASPGPAFKFNGKIAYLGVFGALDVAAKTRIAGYLNATYGTSITF